MRYTNKKSKQFYLTLVSQDWRTKYDAEVGAMSIYQQSVEKAGTGSTDLQGSKSESEVMTTYMFGLDPMSGSVTLVCNADNTLKNIFFTTSFASVLHTT